MFRTFIQVTSLILTLMSAIFLIKGITGMQVKDMAELSTSKWNYNLDTAKNLTTQKADTIVGVILLLSGFTMSLGDMLWEMRCCDFKISKTGVIIAIAFSAMIFFIANYGANRLQDKYYNQVKSILTKDK